MAQAGSGGRKDRSRLRYAPPALLPFAPLTSACAVLPKYRGGGTGKLLMTSIEEHVRNRRGKAGEASKGKESVTAVVHSQMHAEGFYAKAGYVREGDKFMEVRRSCPIIVHELTNWLAGRRFPLQAG